MNWRYQKDDARLKMDSYIQSLGQAIEEGRSPGLDALKVAECDVERFTGPPCLRLVRKEGEEQHEVSVTIPGIICEKTLPPVYQVRSSKPEHVRYFRQFVRLTGLGSHTFEASQDRLNEVFERFRSAEGVENMKGFNFGRYEEQYCVDLHSRYLTERRYVPGQRHIDFTNDIDPDHALEDARDTQFIRVEDNVVQYSKKVDGADGVAYYEPLAPKEFKEGDIVEATGTFIAYPAGEEGEYKLVFCLRALTMLCSTFREESRIPKRKAEDDRHEKSRKRTQLPSGRSVKRNYITYGPRDTVRKEERGMFQ
ncbi:hypothetical protein DFP72DRAFT_1073997 [Ephemerocybe angulata]|uniref:Uncharacterized protein n=1 Tax=Ephemerocybe angulata TaxID=980116 RepID=A0A8H6LYD1_9AGAR|nr:hypothetical protein DFP72DRAFT_1073993 [Tulosesus angulatus]KAF6748643.1 hypothetical protein DFP72DRAFT_1073997 [Tulosesus angulatus]